MRALTVLLLCTCLASSAFAQLNPFAHKAHGGAKPTSFGTAAETPTPNAAAAADTATPSPIVNGKFTVGYEGRGDYLKNEQLKKQMGGGASAKPAAITADANTKDGAMAEAKAKPQIPAKDATVAPAAAPAAPPALRSDSSLTSDASKAKAAAAAATPATTSTVAPAPTNSTGPVNNPMILVGGKRQ